MKPQVKTLVLVFALILHGGIAVAGSEGPLNTYYGQRAGYSSTTGKYNTFLGAYAGYFNTTGYHNTFVGTYAGRSNTIGSHNTFLGNGAGSSNQSGRGNVFIRHNAGRDETGSNKLIIDNRGTITPLIYGEFDNDIVTINGDLYMSGSICYVSDTRTKTNIMPIDSSLGKVLRMRRVTYEWKQENSGRKISQKKHYGVIA